MDAFSASISSGSSFSWPIGLLRGLESFGFEETIRGLDEMVWCFKLSIKCILKWIRRLNVICLKATSWHQNTLGIASVGSVAAPVATRDGKLQATVPFVPRQWPKRWSIREPHRELSSGLCIHHICVIIYTSYLYNHIYATNCHHILSYSLRGFSHVLRWVIFGRHHTICPLCHVCCSSLPTSSTRKRRTNSMPERVVQAIAMLSHPTHSYIHSKSICLSHHAWCSFIIFEILRVLLLPRSPLKMILFSDCAEQLKCAQFRRSRSYLTG